MRYPIEKEHWGDGPWQDEPDRVAWRHGTGLPCLVKRGPSGALCGYVAVPPGHPAHESDYDVVNVRVHGGLTYAASCDGDEDTGICHVPEPGEPDNVWWLGFDCAHAFDLCPATVGFMRSKGEAWLLIGGEVYRDLAYVRTEVEALAGQLAALGGDAA